MDKVDLNRFKKAQEADYDRILGEIRNGKKETHWMWFIFPQIIGLGESRMSIFYSLKNLEEAKDFMKDELLGARMNEVCIALLNLESDNATEIFGTPDDYKLQSSMTISKQACPENAVFQMVLDKFFEGKEDRRTVELIGWRESIQ